MGLHALRSRSRPGTLANRLWLGVLFGSVAVVGMLTPVRLQPGLIFDGRSIILGLAGLVGGPVVALVAATVAGGFRFWLGGVGMWMGVGVAAEAAALGAALHGWTRRAGRAPVLLELWGFGLAIHGIMALLVLTLPADARAVTWTRMGPALLVVYPLATMLVCRFFLDFEDRARVRDGLAASEARYRAMWQSSADALIAVDPDGRVSILNPAAEALLGRGAGDAHGRLLSDVLRFEGYWHQGGIDLSDPVPLPGGWEHRIFRAEGGRDVPVSLLVAPIRDDTDTLLGTLVVVHDRTGEVEAQRALDESRVRMDLALQGADLGTWDWDIDADQIAHNERWAEMLGYDPGAMDSGRGGWESLIHPDDLGVVRLALQAHLDGHTSRYETEHRRRHADGHWIWVQDRGRVLERDAKGRPLRVAGTLLDISRSKATTERLREALAFNRAVMDNLPIGIAVNSVDPEVAFSYMNDNFPRIYRTTREALAAPDAFWEAVYENPEVRERLRHRVLADCATGDLDQMKWDEVPIERAGERTTFVSARNVPVPGGPLMMSTVWDVTDRKETEEALRESEARFRRLAENAPDVIFRYRLHPAHDRGLEYVSPFVTEVTGHTPADLYTHPQRAFRLVHPDDREQVERLLTASEPPPPDGPLTVRWMHRDGRVVWIEVRTALVRDPSGQAVALEGVARDVTERMRQQQKIRALTESLEEKVQERTRELQEANAELESFSYSVSHDLKAPLRAVDGYSALLEEEAAERLGDEGRRLLAEIRGNAQQMGRLIEDLLAYSRVGRADLSREPVDLGTMVEALIEQERRAAPDRDIELVAPDLPTVHADPTLFRQAMANLLANAVKFTRPRPRARIEVTAERRGSRIEVVVRDNGVGFDPKYKHKLFKVFERLHYQDEFEGTGVGLAIVKRILERHGGSVTADGVPDQGVTVRLTLPDHGRV